MKINFYIAIFFLVINFSSLKAENVISLKKYLEKKNIEEGSTQIYLLGRCSAVYVYASAVILKIDSENSKKFIEIANNLLFKSIELRVIHNKDKLESATKKAERERENLFKNYSAEGKKNWDKNQSFFKGSYIAEDMAICSKLVEDK